MSSALRSRAAACVAAVLAAAGCADSGAPLAPASHPAPAAPVQVAAVSCSAQVQAARVTCGAPGGAGSRSLIVGGQGMYVEVTSGNVAYSAGTEDFAFDVTVQNLIPQPMGTTDGTTPAGTGVRIFFSSGPTATLGSVGATDSIAVTGQDGSATFTGAAQRYYEYAGGLLGGDGILSQNETSAAKTWHVHVPPTVLTFSFVVYVSAEVPFPNGFVGVTPPADTVTAGGSQALTATVYTAVGNPVAGAQVTWGTSDPSVATVDGAGNLTAVAPGTAQITATSGVRTGSAAVAVCPNLVVGGTYSSAAAGFCLSGGAGQEYTVIGQNLNAGSNAAFSITGAGIIPVVGPPTPDRAPLRGGLAVPARPALDEAFHVALLQRQHDAPARLGLRPIPLRGAGPRLNIVPGVPSVGTVMSLNVGQGFCTPADVRSATVKSVGTRVILMEDNSNPAGGFTTAQYDSIAATFDTLAYPAVAGNFGAPFDVDANGRVVALYTAAVNDLTPAGSGSYIGGFFYSRDLYSTASCAGSNQGEMFYMLAPDPTGAHGNVRSAAFVEDVTIGTLGHEFQHLINASRRLYGGGVGGPYPLEQVWLNEGLSHVAEEEVYYASSLHGPGENIDVSDLTANATQTDRFFTFAEANFGRLRQWLLRPDTAGPFKNADNLAIRGATWSFLRYAADRRGGVESDLWSGLAFSPDTGLTNLANRLGTDPRAWFRDWAAAMYADDGVPGAAAIYTQPSWNFRAIFTGLDYDPGPGCTCAYPLGVLNPANGVAANVTLSAGGAAAYVRMRVAASAFAGVASTAPGAFLPVTVIRTK
jgi:hypothetical protein